MRLIDAEKIDFNKVFVGQSDFAKDTREAARELINMQPTAIEGNVKDSEYAYQRITHVRPIEHHYEELGEKPYIKYGCPVCEAVGNSHQVVPGEEKCRLCGVNLSWIIEDLEGA